MQKKKKKERKKQHLVIHHIKLSKIYSAFGFNTLYFYEINANSNENEDSTCLLLIPPLCWALYVHHF